MRELMEFFAKVHTSVNATDLRHRPSIQEDNIMESASLGHFDRLPSNLVYSVFGWLHLRDLARLASVSTSLHRIANSDAVCIPAAESCHIDWGAALDRIDLGVPSHTRAQDSTKEPMAPDVLLKSVSNRWTSVLGAESKKERRLNDYLTIRISDQTGEETFFKVLFGTRLGRVFHTYAQRKGVSRESMRFFLDGDKLEDRHTSHSLELDMGDQIDAMLEQTAD